jgi:PilZ domain-containing protein
MTDITMERRSAPRRTMVLAAEVVELLRGAKFSARSADFSRTGCYIDTLNPISKGTEVQLRITHQAEIFMALARIVYVSPGLGMGLAFTSVEDQQLACLDRWLSEPPGEY